MSDLVEFNGGEPLASTFLRLRIFMVVGVAALGLVACGGGGSDGDDSGPLGGGPTDPNASDNIPTTTSLAEVHQLTNDANQEHRLFYIDASHDNGKTDGLRAADAWLMAYDPSDGTREIIDKKFDGSNSRINLISPLALHQATIDASSGEIENYQVASVSYVQDEDVLIGSTTLSFSTAVMRVGVAAGSTPVQVTDKSGTSADLGFLSSRQAVAFNLNDANKAQYVFEGKSSDPDARKYRLTSLDADASTPVEDFGTGFNVQTPLFTTQGTGAGSSYGWLVVDQNKDDCLAFVSNSDLADATCIPNEDGTGQVKLEQDGDNPSSFISGVYPLNNGVVLALPKAGASGPLQVTTTLWFYEKNSGSSGAGTLHLLKNDNGENLETTGLPMFGPDEAGRVVSKGGNTLYLAASDGGIGGLFGGGAPTGPLDIELNAFLFKITTSAGDIGWEQVYHKGGTLGGGEAAKLGDFLIDAGDHLLFEVNESLIAISLDGQSEVLLDGRSSSGSTLTKGAFSPPVGAVSQGDWFFYNREANRSDYATAIKVDGSRRLELKDCTWIGASTSGKANYTGGNFSSLEPSEVFMACNNKQLAAVDANDPLAGRVILGSLTESAESIAMGRSAPGPHRLMRVAYDDDRFEVIYANTSEKNSLEHLMDSPASKDNVGSLAFLTAPVDGF